MATTYPATNQWLMAEDEALKKLLTGLAVPGDKPGRKVPVYFRFPEAERQIAFPFITIDLIAIEPAYDLWTSYYELHEDSMLFEEIEGDETRWGLYEPSVSPSVFDVEPTLDPVKPLRRGDYLPYRLFYQVTTWAKMFAHDRALTAMLIRDIISPRPAWLRVDADSTWRRMESLGWQPADIPTQEGGTKRIFRKAFTISIQSEIPSDRLEYIQQAIEVRRVALRGYYQQDPTQYWTIGTDGLEILHDAGPGGPIYERLDAFVGSASGTVT